VLLASNSIRYKPTKAINENKQVINQSEKIKKGSNQSDPICKRSRNHINESNHEHHASQQSKQRKQPRDGSKSASQKSKQAIKQPNKSSDPTRQAIKEATNQPIKAIIATNQVKQARHQSKQRNQIRQ